MIRLFASVCIEAPVEIVWARLAKLEDIRLWSESVLHASCEGALLTSDAELEIKGGAFGRILEPIMVPMMQRLAPNALAAFKYLVEHGRPQDGKASELPRAPALC
jgi:hypothetical protein